MILAAAAFYLAMSLPHGAPIAWRLPLSIAQCRHVERAAYGAWCQRISVWKGRKL